jgi:hypothetical protein
VPLTGRGGSNPPSDTQLPAERRGLGTPGAIRQPFRADVLVDRLSDGRGGVAEQPYHVQDVDARLKSGRRVRVAQPVGVMRGKPAASASLATDRITVAGFSGSPISSVKTNPARTTSDQRPAVLPRAVGDAPSGRRLLGDRGGGVESARSSAPS